MDSHDNDTKPATDTENEVTMLITSNVDTPDVNDTSDVNDIPSPQVNDVTISSDSEITTIYDIATNTIINMYNFLYAYSEYCVDHNMV